MTEIVAEKLKLLPISPCVYIMKDGQNKIIYVDKAIVLKNRVRQYFQVNKNHSFINLMVVTFLALCHFIFAVFFVKNSCPLADTL